MANLGALWQNVCFFTEQIQASHAWSSEILKDSRWRTALSGFHVIVIVMMKTQKAHADPCAKCLMKHQAENSIGIQAGSVNRADRAGSPDEANKSKT